MDLVHGVNATARLLAIFHQRVAIRMPARERDCAIDDVLGHLAKLVILLRGEDAVANDEAVLFPCLNFIGGQRVGSAHSSLAC